MVTLRIKVAGTLIKKYNENIDDLTLCNTKIKYLPPEIGNLTKLKHLSLDHNKLKYLPIEISKLTNLKYLSFFNNKLKYLPQKIYTLKNLEYLYLSHNKLKFLPNNTFPQLKYIGLSNNQIIISLLNRRFILNNYNLIYNDEI